MVRQDWDEEAGEGQGHREQDVILRTCGNVMYHASQRFPHDQVFMTPEQQVHCNVYTAASLTRDISDLFDEILACWAVWNRFDPMRAQVYRWYLSHILLPD